MRKKVKSIPVAALTEVFEAGFLIGKMSSDNLQTMEEAYYSHRHDCHVFLLAKNGIPVFEIDFEEHKIKTPAIIYMHPNQVCRVVKVKKTDFYTLGVTDENLNPEYLKLLENIVPAKPILLDKETFSIVDQVVSLCANMFQRKQEKLYTSLLKDCCNTLAGLIISQYMAQSDLAGKLSRFEQIAREFRILLERNFTSVKRPSDYAKALNISTPYLNECIRKATGYSVSYHIQERTVLEAKRLLFHSDKSVKEIANELGYEDYSYFSRLFSKTTGMTAMTFRSKNFD